MMVIVWLIVGLVPISLSLWALLTLSEGRDDLL